MRIRTNLENDELYCLYSKERINIGEKYVEVSETVYDEEIVKVYKLENAPSEDDEDDDGLYVAEDLS